MKSHEYYEELILRDEALKQEEESQLSEHLAECEECRFLSDAWEQQAHILKNAQMVKPAAGFTNRWKEFHQQKTAEKEKANQTRLIFGIAVLITILSMFSCLVAFAPDGLVNFVMLISKFLSFMTGYLIQIRTILSIIKIPLLLVGVGAILMTILYIVFGIILTKKIWRSEQGVHNYE